MSGRKKRSVGLDRLRHPGLPRREYAPIVDTYHIVILIAKETTPLSSVWYLVVVVTPPGIVRIGRPVAPYDRRQGGANYRSCTTIYLTGYNL